MYLKRTNCSVELSATNTVKTFFALPWLQGGKAAENQVSRGNIRFSQSRADWPNPNGFVEFRTDSLV